MKKVLIIGLLGILVACQQTASTEQSQSKQPLEQQDLQSIAANVHPTHKLAVPVTGMSCEMACGGSIRKALIETSAVNRVQFDFQMARDTNIAYISYDSNKIKEAELVSLIEQINNGQFHTGKVTEQVIEEQTTAGSNVGNAQSNSTIFTTPELPRIQLPSILDILRTIIFK